ncbi:hypothetical protein LDENG_00253790, partial [Lucifuga dentata]
STLNKTSSSVRTESSALQKRWSQDRMRTCPTRPGGQRPAGSCHQRAMAPTSSLSRTAVGLGRTCPGTVMPSTSSTCFSPQRWWS